MKPLFCAFVFSLIVFSPANAETTVNCGQPFEADLRSGAVLTLDLRSGDIDITGSDRARVHVSCSADEAEDVKRIQVSFHNSGPSAMLRVKDGPSKNVRIRIEVPRETHLAVTCPAGDVDISGVRGDKTVKLRAGDLKVSVGDPADYAEVQASVNVGDLDLTAFGQHKGGFFRRYSKKQSSGTYALRAHLWAGNVTFR